MRSAIEAVAAPVDIPMIDLDQRRTVALDATSTSTGITDLSAARARRIERRNRFVAVAAAVVLLAVAFTAIQRADLDDDDQDNVATESTENAGDSAAAADEALEMFADDRATEEAADMAESAAVETDDWAGADFGDDAALSTAPVMRQRWRGRVSTSCRTSLRRSRRSATSSISSTRPTPT